MAVQQNKQSKSKRGKRRSHDFLDTRHDIQEVASKKSIRYHIDSNGEYRGKKIL